MRTLHLIPVDTKIQFIPWRKVFFAASTLLVLCSIGLFTAKGMNYGIDFTGGILIEVRTQQKADIAGMRSTLSNLDLGSVDLQTFGAPNDVLIRVQTQPGGDKAQQPAVEKVKDALGPGIEYRRVETVGPKVSEELFWDGIYAVGAAMLAILVYIWFRFEWQFGLGAVIALIHDVLSTIGIFSLLGLEFNLSTVAAVLTIAGYSINDTVVVFDRVRENLRRYKSMTLPELLNVSINETLSRTVMTSLTTLLALFALYFLGGEVISGFSFAMIWGVLVGTYSSVCVAVPLLLYLNVRRPRGAGSEDEKEAAEPAA
ncbi:MAG: protein translocase subunit SecF [Hyphomicrobiales bacterium]|nr:protein translocase subunit SecF [Hyphomicrobiales bacterium]MCP5374413.1 protein translocase subunit SecF [Hyphomicrobiales bacterium]